MDIRTVLIVLLSVIAIVAFTGCDGLVITENTDPSYCEGQTGEDFFGQPLKEVCYERLAKTKMDYSLCENTNLKFKDNCIDSVAEDNLDLAGCEKLSKAESVAGCKANILEARTPEGVLAIDDKMYDLEKRLKDNPDDEAASHRLMKLQAIRNSLIATFNAEEKALYAEISEPTNRKIAGDYATGEIDLATKESMFQANKALREKGVTIDDDGYDALKEYHAFLNDPENDIRTMDNDDILKDRFGDKAGNLVGKLKFWETTTADEKAQDQQLRFYARMLEREKQIIDKRVELEKKLADETGLSPPTADTSAVHDNDWLKLTAEQKVAAFVFGRSAKYPIAGFAASLPIGIAISAVNKFATDTEFRGLVRLYNVGMEDELAKTGGDRARAHAEVVKNLEADPTYYGESSGLVGQNNLLVNKDCDGTNPHCINRQVFWQAMQKSYDHQHQT